MSARAKIRRGGLRKCVMSNIINLVLLNELLRHHPRCILDHLINPPEGTSNRLSADFIVGMLSVLLLKD
jgi:hypothetical protein